jgi:transcriptional regulator with XRE-family HTH domain
MYEEREQIMDIGASIKRLRKSHGETQQQLGESVGVVQQSVAAWESNRCMPDIASLVAIATHYNTSTDSILGLTEEPSYLFDTEGMQSYRNDVALADRLPAEIRDGVMALIRLERVKYGR